MNDHDLFKIANEACIAAGEEILRIYERPEFEIRIKENKSPLTEADGAGHDIIANLLAKTGIPVLSEEGKNIPYQERRNWKQFWMVDPLDGTKEFIKRNGEFTVNIALIENGHPTFGSVYVPVNKKLYHGGNAYRSRLSIDGLDTELSFNPRSNALVEILNEPDLTVVASRSHNNPHTEALLRQLSKPKVISMGSSLKFMALAERAADIYPRYAPTMEWDTAAAHAIISSLGYRVLIKDSLEELYYNKEDLLNPYFICF
jgi:3'(2'), 5'-bisphosphate nucleotidase